ncbi:HTH-type transcriptional repressor NsrR [Solibacillus isronensis B3W22]|uniref:HTH-type transcriptional regulator NsrR n=2 Tax=Solibacillus TaxID=648800 RepID=K1KZU6_9BACL|nr:Rrf2 family transcriptional regulator [Solibacillus kalamii]AMO85323.1 Rrf2 family transcriptional regulator [Solibacillus silvestris]EKB44023.1 HTH-type transcriptional repressor NsrR [Solibacillus isronensis B3W22]OBW59355.1 Rrf2 family transcriptional regulator [Solibacillus silvestris]OUZ38660.1 Rrf2 family transcriptional regulator [Solibacillus kalamii]
MVNSVRLTVYTDYSLRTLMYLGVRGRENLVTIQEIADAYQISKNHLMKVTHDLGKLGYIETIRGRGGGIRLAVEPEQINIGEVVRKTEDDFHLVECFNPEGNLCKISPECRLKFALQEALKAYLAVLDTYTLADVLVSKDILSELFGITQTSK